MATDLAKLSLWLATLARDHEFTFLDHALRTGDSLVGLSRSQLGAVHWDTAQAPTFVSKEIDDELKKAEAEREKIRASAESKSETELRPLYAGSRCSVRWRTPLGRCDYCVLLCPR